MHLSDDLISRFSAGKALENELVEIDAHTSSCDECLALVSQATRSMREASARYHVRTLIGTGASSTVHEAFDQVLQRFVALKRIRGSITNESRTRLLNEARIAARLNHPNLITIHDVGEDEWGLYLSMELISGRTLQRWLTEKPRSTREILTTFIAAGRGLAAAHAAGVIHRDFKPDNVLIADDGRVVVTDFGLAGVDIAQLDEGDALRGTPAYLAPEVLAGRQADALSDAFSFCVALQEALSGTRAVSASSLEELQNRRKIGADGEALDSTTLPRSLKRTLRRGLNVEPKARFESMSMLLDALERSTRARGKWWALGAAASFVGALWLVSGPWSVMNCSKPPKELDALWSENVRTAVSGAFFKTERAYARGAFQAVDKAFGAFVNNFKLERRRICETAYAQNNLRSTALTSQLACLDRRLVEATAIAQVLTQANDTTVQRLADSLETLQLGACTDHSLDSGLSREQLQTLLARLAQSKAIAASGRPADALPLTKALATDCERFPRLHAEALLALAELYGKLGQTKDAAAAAQQAVQSADIGKDDETRAHAKLILAAALFTLDKQADGRSAMAEADATLSRITARPEVLFRQAWLKSRMASKDGDYAQAILLGNTAIAFAEQYYGKESIQTYRAHQAAGMARARNGSYAEAREELTQAISLVDRLLGPDHPESSIALFERAQLELHDFRFPEAIADAERLKEMVHTSFSDDHPKMAEAHHVLGSAKASLMRPPEEVLPHFQEAERVLIKAYGPRTSNLAAAWTELGQYLTKQRDFEDADRQFEKALTLTEDIFGPQHPNTSSVLVARAQAFLLNAKPRRALPGIERAMEIQQHTVGAENPETLGVMLVRAQALVDLKEWKRALEDLEFVEQRKSALPEAYLGVYQQTMGQLLYKQPRPSCHRAAEFARQSIEVFSKLKLVDDVRDSQKLLASIERKCGSRAGRRSK